MFHKVVTLPHDLRAPLPTGSTSTPGVALRILTTPLEMMGALGHITTLC